jgi:periplasmic divalent cation tolerance protein
MSSNDVLVVLCTAPDAQEGARLAHLLVEGRAAACVNVVPGLRSIYRWQDEVHDDGEVMLIAKTDQRRLALLTDLVESHHPYDCPEVVALPVLGGLPAYLAWVVDALDDPA